MPIAAPHAADRRRATKTTPELVTVVMIDDHVALRRGAELLLGRRGHVIAGSAADATEGHALIRARRPDVAVIDLNLPGENGAQLTKRLLAEDPTLAVLLYTGVDDQQQIDEALECGARGFALKAGSPEDLIAAIRAVAEGGTYMDPRLSSLMLSRTTTDRIHELSSREREILDLLAQGLTGAQAAKRLWLSPETVRTHVRKAMTKLEARTRVHAVALALNRKEITFEGDPVGE